MCRLQVQEAQQPYYKECKDKTEMNKLPRPSRSKRTMHGKNGKMKK